MSIYEHVDPTTTELESAFWSAVHAVAESAGVTVPDAHYHVQRAWTDRLKKLKPHEAVDYRDDGRAAAWRVRLMLWRIGPQGQEDLVADSDPGAAYSQHHTDPGQTILYGLPAVAAWVLDLCTMYHGGATLDGIDLASLLHKTKSLRVALSNSGGHSSWRIRYTATSKPRQTDNTSHNALRDLARSETSQRYMVTVSVLREESPRTK